MRDNARCLDDSPHNLEDCSPRDRIWDEHRRESELVTQLYQEAGLGEYARRTNGCARNLLFRKDTDGKLRLYEAWFCHVRFCPVCQWRKSLRNQAKFMAALPEIIESNPGTRYIFLTLTIKNCKVEDLRATVKVMSRSWSKMLRRSQLRLVQGYVRSLEVTRADDDLCHPHYHAVLAVPPSYFAGRNYISQAAWGELWREALGVDYNPMVNIKAVRNKDGSDGIARSSINELLKYTVKPSDLIREEPEYWKDGFEAIRKANVRWFQDLHFAMHRARSISVGGIFKGTLADLERELSAEDQLINVNDGLLVTADGECLGELLRFDYENGRYVTADARAAEEEKAVKADKSLFNP